MPVLITGQNLDGTTSARLGTTELRNLHVIDSTQVSALVPWSMAPGTYDLATTNQGGQTALLADAVTVNAPASGWTSNGPFGGDLWDVVLDPKVPARIFVSAQRSGLFKSETGGASWGMSLVKPFPLRTQIAYPTPGGPPVLYLSGDGGMGLQRSLDIGQSWERKSTNNFLGNAFVRSDHPDWVYLARRNSWFVDPDAGLYKSTDLGETWALVASTGGLQVSAVAFDPADPEHMVIGTADGNVYASPDGGTTLSGPVAVAEYIGRLVFAPTIFDGKRSLWATTGDSNSGGSDKLYRSTDGGATWGPAITVQSGADANGITYHESIAGLLWAAVGGGYFSEDDGASWHALSAGPAQIHDIAVVPGAATRTATTLYAATKGGLYKSTDGGAGWQEYDAGLGAVLARRMAVSPFNADEAYAATQVKGFQHTFDGGRSWQPLAVPMESYDAAIATDPFTDGKVFFGNGRHSPIPVVRISSDHGATYSASTLLLPPGPETAGRWGSVQAIAADPAAQDRVLAGMCVSADSGQVGPGFIYVSTDGGVTWDLQSTPAGVRCITRLTFDPSDANLVYAGTQGGDVGLLHSADGGATWTTFPALPPMGAIQSVRIDPRDGRSIYIASFGSGDPNKSGVFVTHDRGASWQKMVGLTDGPVWEMALVKSGAGYSLYAATMNGLRYLRNIPVDPTSPWEYGSGIAGSATIDGIAAGEEEGRTVLYIGTSGGILQTSQASFAGPAHADSSQFLAGGIYRSMLRFRHIYLPVVIR